MAKHYVSPLEHQKLWTRKGQRRSLMIGPSYEANQALLDEHTKHTIYRKHTDDTIVLHTDIVSADPSCPYGDKTIDSQVRRQRMWNDVMSLVTPKSPRGRAFFNYQMPNSFTREQAIFCAEEIGMSISRQLHIPFDYSIHYKPNVKIEDKNIHVHVSLPEWQWENGTFASKGKTYYLDKNGDPITDGVFYDANGNHLRVPMTINNEEPIIKTDENNKPVLDKQGHPIYENQIRTSRGERRWHRFHYENIPKTALSFIHDEIDRIINAEFERSGSDERIVRPNKEIRQKLKEAGLTQLHIGPRSCKVKDKRYYEIKEHNDISKKAEMVLTASYNQQKKVDSMKSAFEKMEAEIKNEKTELAKSEKILDAIEKSGLDNDIANMVENVIQPEKAFISDAVKQYQSFFQNKQKILNPLIQAIENNIENANDTILEKSKKLKTTPRAKSRLKLWNGNIKTLRTFASALKSYSAKSFVQQIQKIAKRRWKQLSPWSQVKYIEDKKGLHNALLYADYLNLDVEDNSYDNIKTPTVLTVPVLDAVQERANQDKNSIGTFDNENFQPKISTEILSEIVSAESALTETSYDDNMRIFTDIDVNAPTKAYRAEIDAIAEQERIAREKARLEAEEREKQLAKEKAEAERIAAEKLKKEQEATATRWVAEKPSPTKDTVVTIFTEEELQEKRTEYNKLAKLRDAAKELALLQLATTICDSAYMQNKEREIDEENYKHGFETDYTLLKYPTVEEEIQKQTAYYRTYTVNFREESKKRKIPAYFEYDEYSKKAQKIYEEIQKSLDAGKSQASRKKPASTTKTNTQTRATRKRTIRVDGDERTKD